MPRPTWLTVTFAAVASAALTWLLALALLGGATGASHGVLNAPRDQVVPESSNDARVAELEQEVEALRRARTARARALPPPEKSSEELDGNPAANPQQPELGRVQGASSLLLVLANQNPTLSFTETTVITAVSAQDARAAADAFAAAARQGAGGGTEWLPTAVAGPAADNGARAVVADVARDSSLPKGSRVAALDALPGNEPGAADTPDQILRNETDGDLRSAALRAILRAVDAGAAVPGSVRALASDTAATIAERDMALTIFVRGDADSALPLLQGLVLSSDPQERERGFNILITGRDPVLHDLMVRVAERGDLGDRLGALLSAIADTRGPRWGAVQMTGSPDTTAGGDFGSAWAAKSEQMGLVTLTLTFDRAVRADALRIRETLAPGGVASIAVEEASDRWRVVWEGRAESGEAPRWFEPTLATSTTDTKRIRIVIDTDRVPGWEEIDAVELIGGGTRQWASAATATSSYSD